MKVWTTVQRHGDNVPAGDFCGVTIAPDSDLGQCYVDGIPVVSGAWLPMRLSGGERVTVLKSASNRPDTEKLTLIFAECPYELHCPIARYRCIDFFAEVDSATYRTLAVVSDGFSAGQWSFSEDTNSTDELYVRILGVVYDDVGEAAPELLAETMVFDGTGAVTSWSYDLGGTDSFLRADTLRLQYRHQATAPAGDRTLQMRVDLFGSHARL